MRHALLWLRGFVVILFIGVATAQTAPPGVESVQIPAGVRYKYADAGTNQAAQSHLLKAFKEGKDPAVLGNRVIIGPRLWQRLRQIPELAKIPKGEVKFENPIKVKDAQGIVREQKLQGKLIQSEADSRTLYSALSSITSGKEIRLRKLLAEELSYYWSIISWDIEEPLFALEAPAVTLLIQYVSKSKNVFFVDALGADAPAQAASVTADDAARKDKEAAAAAQAKTRAKQEAQRQAALEREKEANRLRQEREKACVYKAVMTDDDMKACNISR